MRRKYPRTYHLPFSESKTDDDKTLNSTDHFNGKNIVMTMKMDGESTTFYHDYIHARSLDSKNHPSRNWVKSLHGQIKHLIPQSLRICGENLFAKHSIYYTNLPSYFLVFAIFDEETCLSWTDTQDYCKLLNLLTVPILYVGPWNEETVKQVWLNQTGENEGFVIRSYDSFSYDDFDKNVAKFVRKNHVRTSEHWMSEKIIPNKVINE